MPKSEIEWLAQTAAEGFAIALAVMLVIIGGGFLAGWFAGIA